MDISRVEFKELPEHGIIIAEIRGTARDAMDEFNDKFLAQSTSSLSLWAERYDEKFLMPRMFRAVARKHPDDEWNVEFGKRIALNKLIDKYEASKNKHLANIMVYMDKTLETLSKSLENKKL